MSLRMRSVRSRDFALVEKHHQHVTQPRAPEQEEEQHAEEDDNSPTAGVTKLSAGCSTERKLTFTPVSPCDEGKIALRRSSSAASGRSRMCSLSLMLRAISGPLPIHSTTGDDSSIRMA